MALIACHRSCRKCDGPEKQNCLKCLPQMFFANSSLWGRLCVTNCESVGMYNDEGLNKCVGCHPTCEPDKCFGPSNTQCYDCAPGFVRYDKYTCDTECMPENSFIRGEEECVCMSSFSQTFRMPWKLQEMLWHKLKRVRGMLRALLPILVDMHVQWDLGSNQLWEVQEGM